MSDDTAKSTFQARLSVAKDMASFVQSMLSVVALLAAAVWFYVQRPFSPTIKSHADVTYSRHGDRFEVTTVYTYENTGHVPFHFKCTGMTHYPLTTASIASAQCEEEETVILPGGARVNGSNFEVPISDPNRTLIVQSMIGNVKRDHSWQSDAVQTFQAVHLKDDK